MELIPVLFNIRSVHNTASIFRTADGAGCKKMVLVGYTPSPYDSFGKVRVDFAKVALGAEEGFKIRQFKGAEEALRALKAEGYFLAGLELDPRAVPYGEFREKFPDARKIALVLGNEPKGIPEEIKNELGAIIEIPMRGRKESLNVSVAFGIAVYELTRDI